MHFYRLLLVGLLIYCGAISAIGWRLYSALAGEVVLASQEANKTFTRLFVNEKWEEIRPLLKLGGGLEEIRSNPTASHADALIQQFARGTDLVQVKIFDAKGTVVYARDRALLGQDDSASAGVMDAVRGRVASELMREDIFTSLDGARQARDLVASYVPVKGANGVEAVVEVYTDRAESIEAVVREWHELMLFVGGVLATLLALVFWYHRRQDRGRRHIEESYAQALQLQREATYELVQAEQEKIRFLWGVTQELHQPASTLAQTLRRMAPPMVTGEAAKLLQTATAQSQALQKRVLDFQTVVQRSRGRLETKQVTFHFGDLVRQLGAQLEQAEAHRSLKIVVFVSPLIDHNFIGDGGRIKDVLTVLLDNALAVTCEGCIQIKAHHAATGVDLDVIDTGPGLTEAERQSFAADSARNSFLPTTGHADLDDDQAHLSLGLVMAQGLAKAMGGSLKARSSGASGAWFTLHLPLTLAAPPQQAGTDCA